jgi:hypothetical protein
MRRSESMLTTRNAPSADSTKFHAFCKHPRDHANSETPGREESACPPPERSEVYIYVKRSS